MLSVETLLPIPSITSAPTVPCRPASFQNKYIAARAAPYRFVDASQQQPSSSGGVLQGGQAIWLENAVLRTRLTASVQAFVENVGLVSVDPRLIKKGDGSVLPSLDRAA
jgi:hypothetical protein